MTSPHSRAGVAIVVARILAAEASRRAKAEFRSRMADEPGSPKATPMPGDETELRASLLAMDPYDFEAHVMSFFEKAGLASVVTPRSKDYGMDGYAEHAEGLIVVQCKRNASDNKVGRPLLMQFKTVMSDADAFRGYFVTTSSFTSDASAYVVGSTTMILIDMDELIAWHRNGLQL